MASYSVASSKHATLVAATVDDVTITNPSKRVEVVNRSGVGTIYCTFNGVTPTVAGDDTIVVPAGSVYSTDDSARVFLETQDVVVKLISATADAYSVQNVG